MDRPRLFLGMRTVIYAAPDLAKAKEFYSSVLGIDPYFDEPFYVGFNVGGYELGLDPNASGSGAGGSTAYWGVADIAQAVEHLRALGAKIEAEPNDVGEGIKVVTALDPFGNAIGLIENPNFDPGKTT